MSRQPILLPPPEESWSCDGEVQVAQITSEDKDITISTLLEKGPIQIVNGDDFANEQHKDMDLQPIINYFEKNQLPEDHRLAQRIITEATLYTMSDGILYYVGPKQIDIPRAVVPKIQHDQIMKEYHGGSLAGHFFWTPRL